MKTLQNGVGMPMTGLGVFNMKDREETIQAIHHAIDTGVRLIDTAKVYGNEEEVGEAIRTASVPREQLFITTKVWNSDQGYDETLKAFDASLQRLGLDYIDLYLTHWPVPEKFTETYRAIERLYEEKLIRVPGVSNHHIHHLEQLAQTANVQPMVNQIEIHPYFQQEELVRYCQQQNIAVTAWSPLGRGDSFDDPVLVEIAKRHRKSPAQIILNWFKTRDIITIPKSVTPSRIEENFHAYDFTLTAEEIAQIKSMNRNARRGVDPDAADMVQQLGG